MPAPTISTRSDWLAARKELLNQEKAFMRQRDALSKQRRALPWVPVEREYQFDTGNGMRSLADLFGDRTQLIVYHFMMGEDWAEGCPRALPVFSESLISLRVCFLLIQGVRRIYHGFVFGFTTSNC